MATDRSENKGRTVVNLVTPTFNSAATISRTIASVLSQSGDFEVRYHIQDGGSKDDTLATIQRWQKLLESKALPLSCKGMTLTYESAPDGGMYDAIARGFSALKVQSDDWMGWINSDDYLNQGAFSFLNKINNSDNLKAVNWVASSVPAVACESFVTSQQGRRLVSSYLLKEGVCDGIHWDFLQQEGCFFRGLMWKKIDPQRDFVGFKYAGDWNLWRTFAMSEKIYLTPYSLGVFNITAGQLSANRTGYLDEVNKVVPLAVRRAKLEQIVNNGSAALLLKAAKWNDPNLLIEQCAFTDAVDVRLKSTIEKKFDFYIAPSKQKLSVLAWDADWQFPAITEKHAFERVRSAQLHDLNSIYVGFPWATLVDLKYNKKSAAKLELALEEMAAIIGKREPKIKVITTCQHILMPKFMSLFESLKITDIFWSHATKGGEHIAGHGGIRIHPFPLYPVQAVGKPANSDKHRKLLFSFVGARADKWYLTQSRTWIIEQLSSHPKGSVIARNGWHYEKIVYDHQIKKKVIPDASVAQESRAADEFSEILGRSIFSLCPSGSGPNSIRLWESIGMGAIPVILADTYLPPGDLALWEAAAVFCAETEEAIRLLPARLEAMAADAELLNAKRRAMRQLWMLYGPDSFVYDIQKLILSGAHGEQQVVAAKPAAATKVVGALKTSTLYEVAQKILTKEDAGPAGDLLSMCTTRLLTDPAQFHTLFETTEWLRQACKTALKASAGREAETFRRACQLRGLAI